MCSQLERVYVGSRASVHPHLQRHGRYDAGAGGDLRAGREQYGDAIQRRVGVRVPARTGETAGAGNVLAPNATREVVVPSAIGTEIVFRAVVGSSQVAQITCTVTAAGWAGGRAALVDLFGGDGYSMHCNRF